MNILEKVFRRKPKQPTDKTVTRYLTPTREEVYKSIRKLGECNARMVETDMHWRGGSITPRIAELTRLGYIQVSYRKKGMDGKWRNYYKITGKTPAFRD